MPRLEFPPPEAGPEYAQAVGKAVLTPTGQLLRIEIVDGGGGHAAAPDLSKSLRAAVPGGEPVVATATVAHGALTTVQLATAESGYGREAASR